MKLSQYIKRCQAVLKQHGDIDKFYTLDPKSGCYFPGGCAPEIRYLSKDERVSRSGRVENLIPEIGDDESPEHWVKEHCIDIDIEDGKIDWDEFLKNHTKVIAL